MAYIVNAEIPKHCNKCPFGMLKFSKPLSDYTHGYTCNLEVPEEGHNKTTIITDYEVDIEKPDWCPLRTVSEKDETDKDDVCKWKKSKDYPFDWLVGCDGCEVNHRQGDYCPRCGKKIKVVE